METSSKNELRERILTLLRHQEEKERTRKSLAIGQKLFQLTEFQKAEFILFYASFDGEVETWEMIKRARQLGKRIGLPRLAAGKKHIVPALVRSLEDDLEVGRYGIRQPNPETPAVDLEDIDLVVVPGVAFDKANNRLGRGGGSYDRFLAALPEDVPTVGLAFDFQVVDAIPHRQTHDLPVTRVLSN